MFKGMFEGIKNQDKERKVKKKNLLTAIGIIVMLIALAIATVLTYSKKTQMNQSADAELLRAMTYEQFEEEDAKTETDFVEFGAFFLRDLDRDGVAEKIKGTCKKIGETDTIYMELKVLTDGYLKDGKITINDGNYYFQTTLPKDNEIKENVIGNNVKEIELNTITNGTQKLITGVVRSGNYNYSYNKLDAINRNINNYSNVNKVILTGTHVASDGTETEINKEIEFNIDWYGEAKAYISQYIAGDSNLNQTRNLQETVDEENGNVVLDFTLGMKEIKNELLLKNVNLEAEIPELNGYLPSKVEVEGNNINYEYDETTRKLTIKKETITDESGTIIANCYDGVYDSERYNRFNIKITYPIECYLESGEDTIEMRIPAKGYYEAYNNTNDEFSNPYKTSISNATYVIMYENPRGSVAKVETTIGKYYNYKYFVSKGNPYKIYNGVEYPVEDLYTVKWTFITGTNGSTGKITMAESALNANEKTSDVFIKSDNTEDNMEDIVTNVGIYFSNAINILGDDGEIKVYNDDTGELLVTFMKNDLEKYNANKPYIYEIPVKHIRIETSETTEGKSLYVYHIKSLNDDFITNNYTIEEFEKLKYIKTTVVGYINDNYLSTNRAIAYYEEPYSNATIASKPNNISTQETTKDYEITISTYANEEMNQIKWKNGSFVVKLPKDIIDIDIESISVNNPIVRIVNNEIYEDNNNIFIKINTANDTATIFDIKISGEITPDPRIATTSESIELYYSNENENSINYNNSVSDIYDVNGNLNTEERVGIYYSSIGLISPNSLLTNQTATNYDNESNITIAPRMAELTKDRRQATVNIQLKNNYSRTISEVTILGRTPFEDNKYTINGINMGSTYTAIMEDSGITIPEALREYATIYYSEKEEATRELNNEENGWTEEPNDFSKIRSFMISLGNYVFERGDEYVFSYDISIPNGLSYNDVAYSHHAIYFSLDTENGKYRTYVEPNKVGFMIAKQFDLEVVKYQIEKEKLISGAIYSITEEGKDFSKSRTTNEDGKLELSGLYLDRTYTLREISSPKEYSLNEEEIKFRAYENEDGINVTLVDGEPKSIEAIQATIDEDYKVKIEVEDEVKTNLKILKVEKDTNNSIGGVKFTLKGKGFSDNGKLLVTNRNGEVELKGLEIGETYSLEEIKADGYYLKNIIRFKILNESGNYRIQLLGGEVESSNIIENDCIPTLNITLENDKIDRFKLVINKLEKDTAIPIEGAKFKLYRNNKEYGEYTTDAEGHITIDDLYQEVIERNVESKYILKEVFAPEGYSKTGDISFVVKKENGELIFNSDQLNDYYIENDTVYLNIEDSPSFKLIKEDGETGELLSNVKFAIYDVENGEKPAKNSKGDIIGTKENINGKEYYTVSTNENGEITEDLPEGLYKTVELEADPKYNIENNEEYFGIGKARENDEELITDFAISIGGNKDENIRSVTETSDGGYIVGGVFSSERIELENGEELLNPNGTKYSGMIIKYNSNKSIEWAKAIDCQNSWGIERVIETSDGGYVAVGRFSSSILNLENGITLRNRSWSTYSYSDGLILKYGADGELKWAKNYGGYDSDGARSVIEIDGGDIIVLGNYDTHYKCYIDNIEIDGSSSYSDYGIMIVYSSDGELKNIKSIPTHFSPTDIKISKYGGYLVYGWTGGGNANNVHEFDNGIIVDVSDYKSVTAGIVIKYSDDLMSEWVRIIGTPNKQYKNGDINSVIETSDGGYLIGGTLQATVDFGNDIIISPYSSGTSQNGFIAKYDENLNAQWVKRIGGSWWDAVEFVEETQDGDYTVLATIKSDPATVDSNIKLYRTAYDSNRSNFALIKYKTDGTPYSAKVIGGNGYDEVLSFKEMSNGNLLLGGSFSSPFIELDNSNELNNYSIDNANSSSYDGMIMELRYDTNSKAMVNYKQSIGGNYSDYIESIAETSDGGYIVTGEFSSYNIKVGDKTLYNKNSNYEGLVVKYDLNNNIEWAKTLGGSSNEYLKAIIEAPDKGYLIVGYYNSTEIDLGNNIMLNNSSSTSTYDGMIIKLDKEGNTEWAKNINGSKNEYIRAITATKDGGFAVCGDFESNRLVLENGAEIYSFGASDGFVIKFKDNNDIDWIRNIGGNQNDYINAVIETSDDNYLVGGYFYSSVIDLENGISLINNNAPSTSDGMLIKLDCEGNAIWTKNIGEDKNDLVKAIIETNNKEYVVAGNFGSQKIKLDNNQVLYNFYTNSNDIKDIFIIRYGENGETLGGTRIGGRISDSVNGLFATSDGGYLVATYLGAGAFIGNNTSLLYSSGVVYALNNEKMSWAKAFGSNSQINTILEREGKEYLVGGYIYSNNEIGLNVYGSCDGFIAKIIEQDNVQEKEEITIKNYRKEFKITTEVKEVDNIKGGTISGENEEIYEVVKYGDSNTKEIKMIPDDDYEILDISINDNKIDFTVDENGVCILPILNDITEDKHIVVRYALKDNKIIINKVDGVTSEPLEGAKFEIKEIEGRTDPDNDIIIGNIVNGRTNYNSYIGTVYSRGQYYLIEKDGKYIATNGKSYQQENGGSAGISNSEACSYAGISLSNSKDTYIIEVDASISSEEDCDIGYAILSTSYSISDYDTDPGLFMRISGDQESQKFISQPIQGGSYYYLHFIYKKNGSVDYGNDELIINNINIYKTSDVKDNYNDLKSGPYSAGEYYMKQEDDKYISTNSNINAANTRAISYCPINLSNYEGIFNIDINASISSEEDCDIGYAIISTSSSTPNLDQSEDIFMKISGEKDSQTYTSPNLEGGKYYYLFMIYDKNEDIDYGDDRLVINSIDIHKKPEAIYNFEENEGKYISTNHDGGTISVSYIPIDLKEFSGKYKLIVNAEISSQKAADCGYAAISGSTSTPNYYNNAGKFIFISGDQKAKDYTTILQGGNMYYLHLGYYKDANNSNGDDLFKINSVSIELCDNELYRVEVETNSRGQAIEPIPFGRYSITEIQAPEGYSINSDPLEIDFTSEDGNQHEFTIENIKSSKVIVHHYIKGTTEKLAEDVLHEGREGDEYKTSPIADLENYELEKDENEEFILPDNWNGTYEHEDQEVIYYYVRKAVPLIVHHYIEGTLLPVPLEDGTQAEDINENGNEGEEYSQESISEDILNEKYELVETPENAEGTYESPLVEVTFYYRVKKFNVTTSVKPHEETNILGETTTEIGGQISGEEAETYEIVEYGEDSTKEIKAIPDIGYVVKSITVNGIPIEFTSDDDGSVTLNNFIAMRENKDVIVEFQRNQGIVTVHHYIEGTEKKVPSIDGNVVEDEIKQGSVGNMYATKPSENRNPMYECVSEVGETSGKIGADDREVIYYYRLIEPNAEISVEKEVISDSMKEYEEETETKEYPILLAKDNVVIYNITYNYTISNYFGKAYVQIEDRLPAKIDIEQSDLDGGTYDSQTNTITWTKEINGINTFEFGEYEYETTKTIQIVYKGQDLEADLNNEVKAKIEIYYPDFDPAVPEGETNKVLVEREAEDSQILKQEYAVKIEVKKIWNDQDDTYEHRPENITIEVKANDNIIDEIVLSDENNWEYEKDNLPKYDENDEEIIYTIEEKETNENDLELYLNNNIKITKTIEDYKTLILFQVTNGLSIYSKVEKTGIEQIEKSSEEVNYEIHFVSEVINYAAEGRTKLVDILPYKIDEEKSDLDGGVYDEETQTITWEEDVEYERYNEEENSSEEPEEIDTKYKLDIIKEIVLVYKNINVKQEKMTNKVKAEVEISNAELKDMVEDQHDTLINIPGKATVKYIDKNTNEEISEEVLFEGKAGDEYEAEEKEIENYVLVEVEGGREGELPEEGKEVKFYYAKKTRVVERHIDILTNELIEDEIVHDGYEGKDYETEPKDYDNYRVDQNEIPENAKGQMKEEEIVVNYYYKTPARVIIKYLEYETDKKLAEESVITGFVNDQYETQKKEIDGYSFVKSDGAYEGKMTKSDRIVIYYYKQEEQKQNTSSSTNSNSGTTISNYQSSSNKANSNTTKTNTTSNKNTNSNTNTNSTNTATKITAPKTGDVLPIAAIRIIGIVLIINIIQIKISKKRKNKTN